MMAIRVRFGNPSAATSRTARAAISTIGLSKTSEAGAPWAKQRYYSMRGFGSFESAATFCRAFDEVRHFFRSRKRRGETISLADQRLLFRDRFNTLMTCLTAV